MRCRYFFVALPSVVWYSDAVNLEYQGGADVGVSYKKLWHLLIDRGMKKRELCKAASVSASSLSKLAKGENVNIDIIVRICRALGCSVDDIMEILPDEGTAE